MFNALKNNELPFKIELLSGIYLSTVLQCHFEVLVLYLSANFKLYTTTGKCCYFLFNYTQLKLIFAFKIKIKKINSPGPLVHFRCFQTDISSIKETFLLQKTKTKNKFVFVFFHAALIIPQPFNLVTC